MLIKIQQHWYWYRLNEQVDCFWCIICCCFFGLAPFRWCVFVCLFRYSMRQLSILVWTNILQTRSNWLTDWLTEKSREPESRKSRLLRMMHIVAIVFDLSKSRVTISIKQKLLCTSEHTHQCKRRQKTKRQNRYWQTSQPASVKSRAMCATSFSLSFSV